MQANHGRTVYEGGRNPVLNFIKEGRNIMLRRKLEAERAEPSDWETDVVLVRDEDGNIIELKPEGGEDDAGDN